MCFRYYLIVFFILVAFMCKGICRCHKRKSGSGSKLLLPSVNRIPGLRWCSVWIWRFSLSKALYRSESQLKVFLNPMILLKFLMLNPNCMGGGGKICDAKICEKFSCPHFNNTALVITISIFLTALVMVNT